MLPLGGRICGILFVALLFLGRATVASHELPHNREIYWPRGGWWGITYPSISFKMVSFNKMHVKCLHDDNAESEVLVQDVNVLTNFSVTISSGIDKVSGCVRRTSDVLPSELDSRPYSEVLTIFISYYNGSRDKQQPTEQRVLLTPDGRIQCTAVGQSLKANATVNFVVNEPLSPWLVRSVSSQTEAAGVVLVICTSVVGNLALLATILTLRVAVRRTAHIRRVRRQRESEGEQQPSEERFEGVLLDSDPAAAAAELLETVNPDITQAIYLDGEHMYEDVL